MNKSFEVYKQLYKPYRYTIKGKSVIFESTSGNYVLKENSNDVSKLFNYLKSRGFNNIPNIVDYSRNNSILYEYLPDTNYPKEQRAIDLVKVVANLHLKTSYDKDVVEDKYKEIYDNIKSNILYLNELYDNYYDDFFKELYLSPSKNIFMQNYSKIKANLKFCEDELDNYYLIVKNKKSSRVVTLHNNLELNHFIKNDKEYLISWDNSLVDTPVIDLVKLYKKEYFNLNFENILKTYWSIFNYSQEEKKLFFILISLPDTIIFEGNELLVTTKVRKILDYIYKTENLIRPYYSENQKEE